ncbi:MAG: hypothetical protein HOO98_17560 [Nitrospira sp.]|nr:hypothetical protein [Nitrospira sp.]
MTKYNHVQKQCEIEWETRTAYLNAQAGYSRIASTACDVEARVKARDGQQRGYKLGAATIVTLLESKKDLLKFRLAHARYDCIRSLVALRVLVGTLTRTDLGEFNSWMARSCGLSIGTCQTWMSHQDPVRAQPSKRHVNAY